MHTLEDEVRRLKTLRQYAILDTLPERALDDLTALAAHICDAPLSQISLVDENRQWFKSKFGFSGTETSRDISFCGQTIFHPGVFVVEDAVEDKRFSESPLVTGELGVRFYAGAPLLSPDGQALGALCVMDRVPRQLQPAQLEALRVLSRQVMAQLELRRQAFELEHSQERLRMVTDNAHVGLVVLNEERRYVYTNAAFLKLMRLPPSEIIGQRVADVMAGVYEEQIRPQMDRAFAGESVAFELHKPKGEEDLYYSVKYEPARVAVTGKLVVGVITDITERKNAEADLRASGLFAQSTIDALSVQLCVLDETGTILATNEAWRRFAVENSPATQRVKTGDNYLRVCDTTKGQEELDARAFATGIRAVIKQEQTDFTMEYACHSPKEKRWFLGRVTRFPLSKPTRVVVGHENITARKLGEISALRLAAIVESSDDAIIGKGLDSIVTSWNRGAENIFGYTAAEMIGKSIMRIIPADRHAEEELIITKIGLGESIEHFETIRQTKDGRLIQVSVTASPIRDASGKIIGVSKVARDITERQKAEESRRASDARYHALFDYAPDGILIQSPDNRFVEANASLCRMLGYTREEFFTLRSADIVAAEEIPQIAPALELIRSRTEYNRIWRFRRKDGSTFSADVIATMMPDGNLLAMIRDITERLRVEGRFRRLVDSNVQGVMFANGRNEIVDANDAFLKIIGYSREEMAAGLITWTALTPPEYADADRRAVAELKAKGTCTPYEKEYVRRDGSRVAVLVGAASFEDSPGDGVCFVIDLTERKKLEQQFLRVQRMESIGTLAGGIAHDLNNILAPILMSVEVLRDYATDEQGQSLLDNLRTCAKRGASLVKQVLSFARGMEGERVVVDPQRLMEELLKVLRDTFPKSITVQFELNHELWMVNGDATQLHQVFLNLCVNARDAMPSGGLLTVTMENVMLDETYSGMNLDSRPGAYVLIKVADTGTGIPPEIKERIFEPFFTTKPLDVGTGLGLSTTLAIVKSHGGFIHVYSEMGKGTRFKVYIPANTGVTVDKVGEQETELPHGDGELILVVDDEDAIRTVAQKTLERFGYRVLIATNGAEAVARFAQHREDIAVVLTDMAMPVMGGAATIVALRAMNPGLKIIGSSGMTMNEGDAKTISGGVQAFVPKPYTADALLRTLRKVITAGSSHTAY